MVKTGAERAEKFSMKHDAYVNMLRAKKMDKSSLKKFQDDLYLHVKLQEYIASLDLPYGKLGEFGDLANKFLFKGTDVLADLERFEIPLSYFEDLLSFISEIQFLFEKCIYPTSKVKSKIDIEPQSFEQIFPETIEKLIFDDLTFELEPAHPTSCFLADTKVCMHNTTKTVSPLLPTATAKYSSAGFTLWLTIEHDYHNAYNFSPILNIGVEKT